MPIMEELQAKWRLLKEFYHNPQVKFQLIKYMHNREFAYLVPQWIKDEQIKGVSEIGTRNWRCHNVQSFDAIMNKYIFGNYVNGVPHPRVVNLYTSLAKYMQGMPHQPLGLSERHTDEWKATHWQSMAQFDFLVDIDARPISQIYNAWHGARALKRLYDKYNVAYSLRYSMRGFHLIVPGTAMPALPFDPKAENSIYLHHKAMVKLIANKVSGLTDETTWDSRQLLKLPFSLVFGSEGTYMSYEFKTDSEFTKFFIEDYDVMGGNFKLPAGIGYIEPFVFNRANITNPAPMQKLKKYLEGKR